MLAHKDCSSSSDEVLHLSTDDMIREIITIEMRDPLFLGLNDTMKTGYYNLMYDVASDTAGDLTDPIYITCCVRDIIQTIKAQMLTPGVDTSALQHNIYQPQSCDVGQVQPNDTKTVVATTVKYPAEFQQSSQIDSSDSVADEDICIKFILAVIDDAMSDTSMSWMNNAQKDELRNFMYTEAYNVTSDLTDPIHITIMAMDVINVIKNNTLTNFSPQKISEKK
jgi:hypothetical protein